MIIEFVLGGIVGYCFGYYSGYNNALKRVANKYVGLESNNNYSYYSRGKYRF